MFLKSRTNGKTIHKQTIFKQIVKTGQTIRLFFRKVIKKCQTNKFSNSRRNGQQMRTCLKTEVIKPLKDHTSFQNSYKNG